jgi:hypothetical protein
MGCLPRRVSVTVSRDNGGIDMTLQIHAAVAFAGDGIDARNSVCNLTPQAILVEPFSFFQERGPLYIREHLD